MARTPRDLVVRFLADTLPFLKGSSQVRDALSDTARDLDDLADSGEDSARRLSQAYRRAGDSMQRDVRDSNRKLKGEVAATGKEAGAEFAQNLGQSLSSGDASRIVQDSVGGLVGSLAFAGPVGAAVAAGGAIALGLWNAFEQTTKAREQAIRDAASTIFSGLLADGADFVAQYRNDVLRNFFDPASTDEIATNAKKAADAMGENLGKVLAGSPESIAAYAEQAADKVNALQDIAAARPLTGPQADQLANLAAILEYLNTITTGWKTAEDAVNDYNAALQRAEYYAQRASSYAVGGSTYQSQLGAAAKYGSGSRTGNP